MSFVEINTTNSTFVTLFPFIITISVIWIILFLFSWKRNGLKKTVRYFVPMIGAALFLEAAAVASGRYLYPGYFLYLSVLGGSVPLIILLGWSTNLFLFLNISKQIATAVTQKITLLRTLAISLVAGCFGVCLDLLEDPIAHHNSWWIWTTQNPAASLFGVPITNFLDWFIILFFMALTTQLIDQAPYSENKKLLLSFISISYVGAAIYLVHEAMIILFS